MKKIILIAVLFSINNVSGQKMNAGIAKKNTTDQKQNSIFFEQFDSLNQKPFKIKSLIIPAALISYGFIALENDGLKKLDTKTRLEIKEDQPYFITRLDNYLQYSPALAVYVLNALGIKGKNSLKDRTMIYTLSTVISTAIVLPLKKITNIQRPDGSAFNSFPSGHTTTAFAAAEFLRMEYKDVSSWYGIAGYTVAAATGILRLYNNKHWVSDVVAGAGFGILSTKLAYWIYPSVKRVFFKDKPVNTMVMPYYLQGGIGLALVYNFGR
jgi:membrane-associated phospholipid phosphatase